MKQRNLLLTATTICLLFTALAKASESPEEFSSLRAKGAKRTYEKSVENAKRQYVRELKIALNESKRAGKLDEANLIAEEIKLISVSHQAPKETPKKSVPVARVPTAIAESEGVDGDVLSLFALFHDSRRINDGRDRDHGMRGAALARELHGTWFRLSDEDLARLCCACEHHTNQTHHSDPIIGICWDADRLDLPRVGIDTDINYLNSFAALNEIVSSARSPMILYP